MEGESTPMGFSRNVIWAVVTARKGSKRLPGKNAKPLCGRPMIAYTLEAALKSRSVGRVLVSTDDPAARRVAEAMGIAVPYRRPAALCGGRVPSLPVVRHVVSWWEEQEREKPGAVMLLQPTSPLRTAADMDKAAALFHRGAFDSLGSFSLAREHPACHVRIGKNGAAAPLHPQLFFKPGGEPERLFVENGAVYIVRRDVLFRRGLYGKFHGGYVMPRERSVDVDTEADFLLAEYFLKHTNPHF